MNITEKFQISSSSLYWHCIAKQQVYLKLNQINHWQGKAAGKSYSPREQTKESKSFF